MRNHNHGFKLIEAVIFASLIEVFISLIAPRFIHLITEARISTIKEIEGAIRSAASIAHLTQVVNNLRTDANITMEKEEISMLNGYPTADAEGILKAIGSDNHKPPIGFTIVTGSAFQLQSQQAHDPSKCYVSYTAARPNGSPTITSLTEGC
jgi:MSHA pilin protein MshA